MTLRQLEVFIAVVSTRSFSRGAEIERLTQSTVSQHISALEDEVGVRLFDRNRSGATLTAAGQLFLRHARRVLAERDLLYDSLAAFKGMDAVTVTIGASNIPSTCLLPPFLPRLAQRQPGIVLSVRTGASQEILEKLVTAEVELAVVGSRRDDPAEKILFVPLGTDRLILVAGADSRFVRKSELGLDALKDIPLVMREAGSGTAQALLNELRRKGIDEGELTVVARFDSNEAVCRTVAAGYGCAFVSERSVARELETGELQEITVAGLLVERQFWLARMRARTLSPAAEAVMDLLQECCSRRQE